MTEHKEHLMEETSLSAYEEMKDKLGERQLEIYNYLKSTGRNATDCEIMVGLGQEDTNYVRPRRFELVNKFKLVGFDIKRKCEVTGKLAMAWKIVGEHLK